MALKRLVCFRPFVLSNKVHQMQFHRLLQHARLGFCLSSDERIARFGENVGLRAETVWSHSLLSLIFARLFLYSIVSPPWSTRMHAQSQISFVPTSTLSFGFFLCSFFITVLISKGSAINNKTGLSDGAKLMRPLSIRARATLFFIFYLLFFLPILVLFRRVCSRSQSSTVKRRILYP